ncbi:uncharacterized protein LOC124437761 [Xenia sp. Carnegie-2017]|uniref:uncharacterized protein LOC124437761 n=1 Tax=Xenia sp. Carnegie-2017 TaxID=2897299 RepID=UPI001F043DB2|nr:uncharacterized protein LOC124437761 [Xenia sp. Carnegie-2017]
MNSVSCITIFVLLVTCVLASSREIDQYEDEKSEITRTRTLTGEEGHPAMKGMANNLRPTTLTEPIVTFQERSGNDLNGIDKKTTQNPSKNAVEPTRMTSTKPTEKSIEATRTTSSKLTEKSIEANGRTSSQSTEPCSLACRTTTTNSTTTPPFTRSESSILSFDLRMVFILVFIFAF